MHDLEQRLAGYGETLDRHAQPVALFEIEQAIEKASTRDPKPRMSGRGWRGPAFAVGAALVSLVVVGVPLLLQLSNDASKPPYGAPYPTDGSVGLHGLPPEDAAPNTPFDGELVLNMWAHFESDEWFSLYLYQDGRLIWQDGADPKATTGWVEQRLTPEGVSLVHDEIIATRLFDSDNPGEPRSLPALGHIQIRIGDQLVVRWNRTVMEHPIRERLRGLHTWLPASAWADPQPRMYVPARYGVCLEYSTEFVPPDPSNQLAALPAEAQELLAEAMYYRPAEIGAKDPVVAATSYSPHCYEVTTEQARTLAEIFDVAGLTRGQSDIRLAFGTPNEQLYIPIVPFMPHDAPAA